VTVFDPAAEQSAPEQSAPSGVPHRKWPLRAVPGADEAVFSRLNVFFRKMIYCVTADCHVYSKHYSA
ncbi:hypothetical protein, partial [Mycobacterium avium]|uniref:hypothetical protein n=1 Tax=Mycobacterium avium TaxID=1764 RepID=UPI001F4271C3